MGTSIQKYKLEEEDYRGERYKNHHKELKGNNDLLVITKPEVSDAAQPEHYLRGRSRCCLLAHTWEYLWARSAVKGLNSQAHEAF